jgi:hypothetical protein
MIEKALFAEWREVDLSSILQDQLDLNLTSRTQAADRAYPMNSRTPRMVYNCALRPVFNAMQKIRRIKSGEVRYGEIIYNPCHSSVAQ